MQTSKRMERVLFKGFVNACFFAALVLLLGCSPQLNWRTVQSLEQRYTALFPGKPDKLERHLSYQDQEVLQTLEAVKVDDDIYSVSSIELTSAQVALGPKLISQLQANLLDRAKASGSEIVKEDSSYQTLGHQHLPVQDYFLVFHPGGKAQQIMRVRWITRSMENGGVWIYQISVLHSASDVEDAKAFLSKEEYSNFFNEFYPE